MCHVCADINFCRYFRYLNGIFHYLSVDGHCACQVPSIQVGNCCIFNEYCEYNVENTTIHGAKTWQNFRNFQNMRGEDTENDLETK